MSLDDDDLNWGDGDIIPLGNRSLTNATNIRATPYVWRDPATIPPRPWVYGRQLLRGTVSLVVAPGGTGKSALMTGAALAMVTGNPFLGLAVWGGPKRVWLWNLEDAGEELARTIQAAAQHWNIDRDDVGGRLFVDSGLDGAELKLAVQAQHKGFEVVEPVANALLAELMARQIDVLIIDPFISSHSVPENDNGAIDAVAKQWARIAAKANCSIVLVHHTGKQRGAEVDADSARGASALVAAARFALALNVMTKEEGAGLGIERNECGRYVRADAVKSNRAPAGKADWFELQSVALGNGNDGGDWMPVVVPWTPPDAFAGISVADLRRVQAAVAEGVWRHHFTAKDWVGKAVANVLGLNVEASRDKARIKTMVREWIANGALKVESMKDPKKREPKDFVVVGCWAEE